MFRKTLSQIISGATSKSVVNRPLSKKIPEKRDWMVTETSRCKSTSSKSSGGRKSSNKTPCEEKKNSPCAEKKVEPCTEKKFSPCAEKKVDPCEQPKQPCDEVARSPCDEKKSNPCSKKTSPCSKPTKPCDESSKSTGDNCYHHKDLIPPGSLLSKLKTFELRSNCSSFHMKSTG